MKKDDSQFKTLVENGMESAPFDGGLLFAAIGEEATRQELNDDKRVTESIGIQRNDVPGGKDLDAQAVVVEVDANVENAVRSVDRSAAMQLLLLPQPANVIQIDQLLRFRFVQGDFFFDPLVRRALERLQREALAFRVKEIQQHLKGAVQSVVKLAEFVLELYVQTITTRATEKKRGERRNLKEEKKKKKNFFYSLRWILQPEPTTQREARPRWLLRIVEKRPAIDWAAGREECGLDNRVKVQLPRWPVTSPATKPSEKYFFSFHSSSDVTFRKKSRKIRNK